jgi:hypothetical protein
LYPVRGLLNTSFIAHTTPQRFAALDFVNPVRVWLQQILHNIKHYSQTSFHLGLNTLFKFQVFAGTVEIEK